MSETLTTLTLNGIPIATVEDRALYDQRLKEKWNLYNRLIDSAPGWTISDKEFAGGWLTKEQIQHIFILDPNVKISPE